MLKTKIAIVQVEKNVSDEINDTKNQDDVSDGVLSSIGKFFSNEAMNCNDDNVLSTVKELVNETVAREISASIYVQSFGDIAEINYNPELQIRSCHIVVQFNRAASVWTGEGFLPQEQRFEFIIQNDTVKLGHTI